MLAEAILSAFVSDRSGKLDLIEFTDLCKSLQTFTKFDSDGSGEIDIEELRPALRRLGIPSDNMQANAVMRWYDADDSGKIELPEFAMLARDIAIFNSFDTDANGALDAGELLPALSKLGLAVAKDEVAAVLNAWDNDGNGTIDLLNSRRSSTTCRSSRRLTTTGAARLTRRSSRRSRSSAST